MERRVARGFARGVRHLLLIEDADPEHDDANQHEEEEGGDKGGLDERLPWTVGPHRRGTPQHDDTSPGGQSTTKACCL